LPARVQVPLIVPPLTRPVRVNEFPPGDPERTLMPNWPETFPLKLPERANVPLSVSPETKQAESVENRKLLTARLPLEPVATSAVVKAKAWPPPLSVKVAVQLPLMLPALLSEPQPTRISPSESSRDTASVLIDSIDSLWIRLCGMGTHRDAKSVRRAVRGMAYLDRRTEAVEESMRAFSNIRSASVYKKPQPEAGVLFGKLQWLPSCEGRFFRALEGVVAIIDLFPIDHAPPCLQVFRTTVVVFQVIGVLPDVVAENRVQSLADRVVLIRRRDNLNFAFCVADQPNPPAA